MHNALHALDDFAGRLSNRLIRMSPHAPMVVSTDRPIVSFTFDDVPDTALTAGAAILEKHGVRGTFYIAGGLAGRVEPGRTLIDGEGVRELAARGHEIGCHTFAHDAVRSLGATRLAADLDRNADYLDRLAGPADRRNFAFPYNAGSLTARGALARRYRTCRAGGEVINRGTTDAGFLGAVEIRQPEDHARSLVCWIDDVVENPGWLIFFTHDIADTPTPYGCTPETFERLVAHAATSGCLIETVDDALDRLELRGKPS